MSTKTIDGALSHAPRAEKDGVWAHMVGAISGAFDSFERAIATGELVNRGMDPRKAYNQVYKDVLLRDL